MEEKKNINEWKEVRQDIDERPLEFVKLKEPDQQIEGKLLRTFQSKNYGTNNYVVEVSPDKLIAISGGTVLDKKMNGIESGTDIKVVYTGKKLAESSGREYHDYRVYTLLNTKEFISSKGCKSPKLL